MPVPVVYRDKNENLLVNYSFVDLISHVGYLVFEMFDSEDNSGNIKYHLSPSVAPYGDFGALTSSNSSPENSFSFTTSPFKEASILFGDAYFSVAANQNSGGAGTWECSASLIHYSGATSSSLGSFVCADAVANGDFSRTAMISIPSTNIGVGDYLGLDVSVIAAGSGGRISKVYVDPKNLTNNNIGSSQLFLPFKILQ